MAQRYPEWGSIVEEANRVNSINGAPAPATEPEPVAGTSGTSAAGSGAVACSEDEDDFYIPAKKLKLNVEKVKRANITPPVRI